MATILLYSTNSEITRQLRALCAGLGLQLQLIAPGNLNCTIASILSGKPKPAAQLESAAGLFSQPEVLIFSGLTQPQLEQFLDKYKSRGIAPITLKAAVTPFNCSWSVRQLTKELARERMALGG